MKKMTAEEVSHVLQRMGAVYPLGVRMLSDHIAALEAEATYMNHATLEKAARACADECDNLEPHNIACACSHHEDARRIRALKSKPTQEAKPKRRREHEYGEESASDFGAKVACCKRTGCQAFRLVSRRRTQTLFKQQPMAEYTDEPGPCEVEP